MTKRAFSFSELNQRYARSVSTLGPSYKGMLWSSQYAQSKRFNELMADLPPTIQTLCDLGCGAGDLYDFVTQHTPHLQYTGLDRCAAMIVAAQKAYPTGIFRCLSLHDLSPSTTFDCILASGTFNIRYTNHEATLLSEIATMCRHATQLVRFNILYTSSSDTHTDTDIVYINKEALYTALLPLAKSVDIKVDYLPNDATFTLTL